MDVREIASGLLPAPEWWKECHVWRKEKDAIDHYEYFAQEIATDARQIALGVLPAPEG